MHNLNQKKAPELIFIKVLNAHPSPQWIPSFRVHQSRHASKFIQGKWGNVRENKR